MSGTPSSQVVKVERGAWVDPTTTGPDDDCTPASVEGFQATLEDMKTVVGMLQSLATGKKDQFVTVLAAPQALRVSSETPAKNLYGVAYINVSTAIRERHAMWFNAT